LTYVASLLCLRTPISFPISTIPIMASGADRSIWLAPQKRYFIKSSPTPQSWWSSSDHRTCEGSFLVDRAPSHFSPPGTRPDDGAARLRY
jgi:hypothetical protein